MIYNMDYVKNVFSADNKYKIAGLLVVLLCLIAASLYVYKKSISSKIKDTYAPNQEFVSSDVDKSAVLYYFYTTWCPYCIKALPEWNKFKNYWHHKKKDGHILLLLAIDCDKNESLAAKYEVEKYPCIKLIKDGKVYDYDAKPTLENLNQFLNACFE